MMEKLPTMTNRAISGYAEWFWLMAKNIKPVENRGWSLYRYFMSRKLPVRVYLHASKTKTPKHELDFIRKTITPKQLEEFNRVDFNALRGTIFAKITFTADVLQLDSPWFFGKHGFLCEDGAFIDHPIPYKGWFGFFEVNGAPQSKTTG